MKRNKDVFLATLIVLSLTMIAQNILIFTPAFNYYGVWVISCVLFGLLAFGYLFTYCMLSHRMKDITHVGLVAEK